MIKSIVGVELVCGLANSFACGGWGVIILDVVVAHTALLYCQLLVEHKPMIVQLLRNNPVFRSWSNLERL